MTKKYQPSNGTEGDIFMDEFCFRCKYFNDCEILDRTMIHGVEDEEYPQEWTYDLDDNPICTAFKVNTEEEDLTDPHQQSLKF